MKLSNKQIYDIIRLVVDFIIGIAAIVLVQSCVHTRVSVRHSSGVSVENHTESSQSADSASINLQDMLKEDGKSL